MQCATGGRKARDSGGFDALSAPDRIVPLPLGSAYRAARHRRGTCCAGSELKVGETGHTRLNGVMKTLGNVLVTPPLSLEIEGGESVLNVCPSGNGKSTFLRLIAGLEDTTAGTIEIGGQDATGLPPAKRGLAMVLQNYALGPHMTAQQYGFSDAHVRIAS